ncbi:MAG: hypothetical protein ACREET_17820 [Stellaceae bacterium]
MGATVYRCNPEGWLALAVGAAERLRLDTVGLDLPLAELYRGLPGLSL